MKRSSSAVTIAVSIGLSATALLVAPRTVRAEDQETATARALCEHGAWEAAEEWADSLIASNKPDGYWIKAWALGGRAAKEKSPKLLDQAKKALSDAKAKGARVPAGLDVEKLPPPKFGSGDFELRFAWGLKNRGKIGAAEQVLDAAIAGAGFNQRDMASAKTIRGDLFGERSRIPELGNSDAPKRKEFFEKAKGLYLEVAGTQGLAPELVIEAKGHLYDLYFSRGQGLLESAKRTDDLAAQEALKKEAIDAFKAGVEFLAKECKDLNDVLDKAMAPAEPGKEGEQPQTPQRRPEEFCLIYANYYWPKCMVGQARATADKAEHDSLVKKALDIYNDYNLRFGQEDQGYEAAIDMSEAYKEIGDDESALISLESALAIEKNRSPDFDPIHPPDPKKALKLDPAALDVFGRASMKKGQSLKKKGDWAKAFAALDKPFIDARASGDQVEKEFLATALAKTLLIERAEALARTGKQKEAKAELDRLIKEDENGPIGQSARAMEAKLAGGGSGVADELAGIDGGRALTLMNEALGKGELHTVMIYARLAMRRAKEEAKPDITPQALVGLGQAYFDQGRYYEAAVAYDEVTHRYRDSKSAGEAARGVVNCYNILRLRAPNGHDKSKYEEGLKFLTENFPNEGKGFGDYLLALQYQEEGKYDEAARYYDKVPTDAGDMYDKSLYTASLCRYLMAAQLLKEKKDAKDILNQTAANLKKAIDAFAKTDGVTEDRKKKRFDLDAEARFLLADVLLKDAVNRPAEVPPLFEHAAKDYEGNADRLSRAGFWCILADLKLQRLDAAESELNILLDKYKGEKRTVLAAKEVGIALHREVEAKKKTLSPEDRRKLKGRIAKYYARWILDGSEKPETMPPLRDMKNSANHLFEFALDISGQPEDGGFISEVDDEFDAREAKQIFTDARDIYAKLADPDVVKQFGKETWVILAYWAESSAFIHDWATANKAFDRFLEETKIIDPRTSQLDVNVVGKNKVLLAYYFDVGKTYQMLGATDKANYQKAIDVFSNVVNAASESSRTWWKARYEIFRTMDKRGDEKDFKELGLAMKALERKYPDFNEAGKHGMQEKLKKLKSELEAKGIK